MTYDDCSFEPGSNLVLGPNGTGKSSIISALCVGLAGSPKVGEIFHLTQNQLLGRASKVKDYIKRGKKDAYTEITLYRYPPAKNLVIRRHFKSSGSDWYIDGRSKSQEEVKTSYHL